MRIGIVGYGVVGSAIGFCFNKLGHLVKSYDPKFNFLFEDILDTDVIYICVPTKSLDDGSCDISIVEETLRKLDKYQGVIAIKSTVIPGTTKYLADKYNIPNLCFVPEFLRERCAIADFSENHDICVIGTEDDGSFENVKASHGHYPKKFLRATTTDAELCKYFVNIYNATLITFANSFYEVCKRFGADYSRIKNICVNKSHINDSYLECNENIRAFSGICLPKDLKAIASIMKDTKVEFFENVLKENAKYQSTVFEGMRH